jgi:hypothetical protein
MAGVGFEIGPLLAMIDDGDFLDRHQDGRDWSAAETLDQWLCAPGHPPVVPPEA